MQLLQNSSRRQLINIYLNCIAMKNNVTQFFILTDKFRQIYEQGNSVCRSVQKNEFIKTQVKASNSKLVILMFVCPCIVSIIRH